MPMRLAGLLRERRRDRDERRTGLSQCAIERRKAQIVADRQPNSAPGNVHRRGEFARPVAAGLAVALAAREVDIKHVDLVVARGDLALWVDQERAVDGLLRQDFDGER